MLTTSWPAPGLVVHSPLLRTVQTAALLADHWPAADAIEDPAFVPEASPDAAARRLLHHAAGRATVALVAHLPLLPALHRWFTGADRDFVPAGAVLLEAADDVAWRGAFSVIPEGET
jgi:phosphohistidine phosphatase SixA